MKAALYTGDEKTEKIITSILEKHGEKTHLPARIHIFRNEEDLTASAGRETFDALITSSPSLCGKKDMKVILVSDEKEDAYEAFRARAFGFVLMENAEEDLLSLLDDIEAEGARSVISVRSGSDISLVHIASIEYVEISAKKVYFMMADHRQIVVNGRLSDYEEDLLAVPGFIKCHRSYIVNMERIMQISRTAMVTFTGASIPVARGRYDEVTKVASRIRGIKKAGS